jgi:hypothetical protein
MSRYQDRRVDDDATSRLASGFRRNDEIGLIKPPVPQPQPVPKPSLALRAP